ncbi:MAG: hypothetical protein MUF64_29660, partial [Polyangiaceae bacterium]|nr:hypothetical protein [Polyangiaceae bacterium]
PTSTTLPAPLEDSKRPAGFPIALPEAPEVRFVVSDAASFTRWKATQSGAIYGRLELPSGGSLRLARDVLQGYVRGSTLSVGCSNDGGPLVNVYRLVALRWERLQLAGNQISLDINDGWFDGRDCKIYQEKKTSIPLKPALIHDGLPVMFASRSDSSLVLHFPPAARVVSDVDGATVTPTSGGSLWTLVVPLRKGKAASVLAEMDLRTVDLWSQALQGRAVAKAASSSPRPLQIGIEVLQTVKDKEPTILVRTTR